MFYFYFAERDYLFKIIASKIEKAVRIT